MSSVYNHRAMVPQPGRIDEMLEQIKSEFIKASQERDAAKDQVKDYEGRIQSQLQEMTKFWENLSGLEQSQKILKKEYEEEIHRLKCQLEQAQARNPGGHPPSSAGAIPPSIGPASSNHFGSAMAAPGSQSDLTNFSPHLPQHANSSPHQAPPPPQPQYQHTNHGSQYPRTQSRSSDAAPTKPRQQHQDQPLPSSGPGGLADVDPESVPPNMKVEGKDWFALFNPKTPRVLKVDLKATFEHGSVVCCVKFSKDGRYLAAGCNRTTFIYDVLAEAKVCDLIDESVSPDGDLYIRSVCFDPEGKYLVTGAEDRMLRIWDIAKQRIVKTLSGHEQDIYSLDFSPDGQYFVSGSGDRTARIWSMNDYKCLHTLKIKDLDQKDPGVTSVAFSPDGRLVAAGSLDKMVRVWDAMNGQPLDRLDGHKDSVYSVAFMPDGKTLVSGSLDKTLKLWKLGGHHTNSTSNAAKQTFTGHKDFVLSVACTPDGNWVVSGSKDRGVQFWDPKTGQTQFMLQGHKNSVISVAVSHGKRPLFATGSGDNRARIWSYEPV